jgi:hypothetical protein
MDMADNFPSQSRNFPWNCFDWDYTHLAMPQEELEGKPQASRAKIVAYRSSLVIPWAHHFWSRTGVSSHVHSGDTDAAYNA